MSINEWYEDTLRRRKETDSHIDNVIKTAYRVCTLRDQIDAALDLGDEEAFYALTNELKGLVNE